MGASGDCAACGSVLAERGVRYRVSQFSGSRRSGGLSDSFLVCAWCVEQLRVRGAVLRANARRARMPGAERERYQRAKIRQPPWMQRRQLERTQQ